MEELSGMIKTPTQVNGPSFWACRCLRLCVQEVQYVDVREPWEIDTASLPLFTNFPLLKLIDGGEDDLDPTVPTVLLCHHGRRSRLASEYLMEHGFIQVFNVTGGIDAYSRRVDPSVPVY